MREDGWSRSRKERVFKKRVKAEVRRLLDISRQELEVSDFDVLVQKVSDEVANEALRLFGREANLSDLSDQLVSKSEIFDEVDTILSKKSV